MKFLHRPNPGRHRRSAPTRGPWIEILMGRLYQAGVESAPTRGPWIEMKLLPVLALAMARSAPTRGPWIEISETAVTRLEF